jgi:DNA-binding NtrC family response regulator
MTAVELVVVLVVDVTSFVTASDASKEAFKTATLLKTLNVNSLIIGEVGVGKKSLARYILPQAPLLNATEHDEIFTAMQSSKEIIIADIDSSPNITEVIKKAKDNEIRIIATAKNSFEDDCFSVKFSIPPLSQRKKDIDVLIKKFVLEASTLFGTNREFNFENFKPDLSQNSSSLRRQIMISYLLQDIKDTELISIMQNYLSDKLGSSSDYRNFLYLYEVPLINAGLHKFKSQLKLADKLGLNRNTLRKKIADNKNYLQ